MIKIPQPWINCFKKPRKDKTTTLAKPLALNFLYQPLGLKNAITSWHQGHKSWNQLPLEIKSMRSNFTFKKLMNSRIRMETFKNAEQNLTAL